MMPHDTLIESVFTHHTKQPLPRSHAPACSVMNSTNRKNELQVLQHCRSPQSVSRDISETTADKSHRTPPPLGVASSIGAAAPAGELSRSSSSSVGGVSANGSLVSSAMVSSCPSAQAAARSAASFIANSSSPSGLKALVAKRPLSVLRRADQCFLSDRQVTPGWRRSGVTRSECELSIAQRA